MCIGSRVYYKEEVSCIGWASDVMKSSVQSEALARITPTHSDFFNPAIVHGQVSPVKSTKLNILPVPSRHHTSSHSSPSLFRSQMSQLAARPRLSLPTVTLALPLPNLSHPASSPFSPFCFASHSASKHSSLQVFIVSSICLHSFSNLSSLVIIISYRLRICQLRSSIVCWER